MCFSATASFTRSSRFAPGRDLLPEDVERIRLALLDAGDHAVHVRDTAIARGRALAGSAAGRYGRYARFCARFPALFAFFWLG